MAGWQPAAPGRVTRTVPSGASGMRRGGERVPTTHPAAAAASQVPKCQAWAWHSWQKPSLPGLPITCYTGTPLCKKLG